jgi:hypothetical protein
VELLAGRIASVVRGTSGGSRGVEKRLDQLRGGHRSPADDAGFQADAVNALSMPTTYRAGMKAATGDALNGSA